MNAVNKKVDTAQAVKNSELLVLNQLLASLKSTSKVTVDETLSLVKLKRMASEKSKDFYEAQKLIFDSYKIEPKEGVFNYGNHKQRPQIEEKLQQLQDAKSDLSPLNFMSEKAIVALTNDMTFSEIEFLYNKLVNSNGS